jgi:SAM-dependent methyltransferase
MPDQPPEVAAFATLMQFAGGYSVSRCLHVAADLGIADALDQTPLTAAQLARATDTDAQALSRILRLLSAHGIFEHRDGHYLHTAASQLLRTDHPQSMRSFVRMIGLPIHWASYGELHYSVRTGLPASAKVTADGLWNYYAEHPEVNHIFNEAMTGKAHGEVAGVLRAYDFTPFRAIGDIAGGRGHLLQAILAKVPHSEGVLFDQPHVIAQASALASERLRLRSGDFFNDDMPVCDIYILMDVIHDWNDHDSAKILRNLRRAARPGTKLLLVEAIIPADSNPSMAKVLDIHMLVLTGGRQRTEREFATLLADAGFQFERRIYLGNFSILESTAI